MAEINIEEIIKSKEYDFLRENKHLGKNIICLCLGGSYAYGMNVESSDIDIRGVALNSKEEILLGTDFEQVDDKATDTVIYSLKKFMQLLCNNNPNIVEMIGVREDMTYCPNHPEIWKEIVCMQDAVLSQRAVRTFGGYATSQLRRLENKTARDLEAKQRETHILNSMKNAEFDFAERYHGLDGGFIHLYVDDSERDDMDSEIYTDISLTHYPFRDFAEWINGYNCIIRDYDKLGKRNKQAQTHSKIAKHSAHLVRLYFMAFDILEGRGVITYREKEHELLMDIRNGKYLDENGHPIKEFYELVDSLETKLHKLSKETTLPNDADRKKVEEWLMKTNRKIVMDEI